MDLVVSLEHRPKQGETVLGTNFFMNSGGKGANQAVAARKLGASVSMIGKVGTDLFAERLLSHLEQTGVDCHAVEKVADISTGVAFVMLDREGDNSIVVAPGANHRLTPEDIRRRENLIKQAKLLMVQLEIPLDTVFEAVSIAKKHQVPVLLDPAPALPLPDELLGMVDYIVPNESEITKLTGIEVHDQVTAKLAAVELLRKGVSTVIAKLGAKGVVVVNANRTFFVDSYRVKAVDSTGAGDAFAGAMGTAIVNGKDIWNAAKFASAIGAITVTRQGAQVSMPSLEEAEKFIKQQTHDPAY
jgi:ribokinase